MTHDPLCPYDEWQESFSNDRCDCKLIAEVRANQCTICCESAENVKMPKVRERAIRDCMAVIDDLIGDYPPTARRFSAIDINDELEKLLEANDG